MCDNNRFILKEKNTDIRRLEGVGEDTLSYGYYTKKWNSLLLYSDSSLIATQFDIKLDYEAKTDNEDFIIYLNSPYNEFIKIDTIFSKSFFYLLNYYDESNKNDWSSNRKYYYRTIFFKDTIVLKKLANQKISRIHVDIIPLIEYRSPWIEKLTIDYTLKDNNNNVVSLSVPDFTFLLVDP